MNLEHGNYAIHRLTIKEAKEGSRRFAKEQKQTHFQKKRDHGDGNY